MASRIPPTKVLEHPFRKALLAHIRATPGIAFLELFRHFKATPEFGSGLGYGSLSYHLAQLERARHVTTRRSGRHRRHYVNGGPWNGDTSALAVLQTRTPARLAEIVLAEPGLHLAAIWSRFCQSSYVTRQAIGYQLDRLVELGLFQSGRAENLTVFYGTEKLQRMLTFLEPSPAAVLASKSVVLEAPVAAGASTA